MIFESAMAVWVEESCLFSCNIAVSLLWISPDGGEGCRIYNHWALSVREDVGR
jgi:hypothetical protein